MLTMADRTTFRNIVVVLLLSVYPRARAFAGTAAPAVPSTKPPPPKKINDDEPHTLSVGGADMGAYGKGHVAKTKEYEPTVLPLSTREERLPADFPTGTYFKNGPGAYESDDGIPYLHPFDCNGKILAITLDAQRQEAVYRYKHVRTPKYAKDCETGTMSERGFFGTRRAGGLWGNAFRGMDPKNPANTAVVLTDDQKRLFALWEAGRPFALDPITLETLGEEFCGFLDDKTSFSAHPSYDPAKKTYTNFCIGRPQPGKKSSTVAFQEVDANTFRATSKDGGLKVELPGIITTHDFAMSENYLVFEWNEAVVNGPNALKAMLGFLPPYALVETLPLDVTRYVLIPRDLLTTGETIADVFADDRIKIVETPFHVPVHMTNAYGTPDGTKLIFEANCLVGKDHSYGVDEMVRTRKPLWEAFDWDANPPTRLEQFEIDLRGPGTLIRMETIANESIEFMALPRDRLTRPHNVVFTLGVHKEKFDESESSNNGKGAISPYGSIRKINLDTKEQEVYCFAPHEFLQDGDVVRKAGASPEREDALYFVTVVTNGKDLTSDLVVMDGENLSAGPVTRLRLPETVPNGGLHGYYYPGPNPFSL